MSHWVVYMPYNAACKRARTYVYAVSGFVRDEPLERFRKSIFFVCILYLYICMYVYENVYLLWNGNLVSEIVFEIDDLLSYLRNQLFVDMRIYTYICMLIRRCANHTAAFKHGSFPTKCCKCSLLMQAVSLKGLISRFLIS